MSSAEAVKELRELTGLGMMECKKILTEVGNDFEKAKLEAQKRGLAKVSKLAGRAASEGIIETYIHHDGKLGVMVELNCNTDFVARNDDFRSLAKGIALHVAALNPEVLKREELDQQLIEGVKEHHRAEVKGKPPEITEKIVEGKMKTWYEERVLLDQIYVKDESKSKTVRQVLEEASAKTGENVNISRYCRFKVGESAAPPAAAE
ncbi:elongation factor Ts [bacterium]|nr:elongation factor Ts [bacterium]